MRTRRGLLIPLLVLALLAPASRADDVMRFLYRPGEVPQSRVFVYEKSNLDGSDPQRVEVYVAAEDRVEMWQAPHAGNPAAHVVATINWLTCGLAHVEWWDLPPHADPVPRWTAVAGTDERSFDVEVPGAPTRRTSMHWRPWHLYGTVLATLGMTLGHLAAPTDTFRVGIAAPDSAGGFADRGEARFAYHGDVTLGGTACRLYDVDGPALENRGGTIAIRKLDGFIQEVELGLPDDPRRTGLRLVLVKAAHTSEAGWLKRLRSGR